MSTEIQTGGSDSKGPERVDSQSEGTCIVFFDGVCGLCNGTVNFLLNHDKNRALKFAPLQGETAQRLLPQDQRDLNSIVFLEGKNTWRCSSAITRIFWKLPVPWSILGSLLWVIPKPIRDFGYRIVAKSRYRIFGKKETCRMPTPEDRGQMLE
ncbi:thiol-disulfide oxidoreductase DCC family protein [Thalassoglobus polymorphus]|uniref:Thiol-disulfide oxidoreductase DCC n=1 Tax=Thalassoglobus polymorphus TaxID=2527994 RepID=A0A517QNB9_9PLAN|nr:thiol-disulfide oxidoreductase DCC family protein [Thalassoglobus polymorphus]QDT33084.1 hypothetical protein Mal48_23360 [Thalassoglobus polymorphus]